MKRQLLSFALLLFAIVSRATTVAVSDAQNVATNFFKVNTNTTSFSASLVYTKTDANNVVDFYVFNMSPVKGFVIVSGDDRIKPILAYSTESNFKTGFSHIGINDWVNQTATNVSFAVQHMTTATIPTQNQWIAYRQGQDPFPQRSASVGPLCATTWDQENENTESAPYLYDLFCPYNASDSQRAVTGCVATAMGQIMKYWNYPAQGSDSFGYQYEYYGPPGPNHDYGYLSSDFSAHTYQWSQMPDYLDNNSDPASDTAVAQLLYDCGISVGMQYGDDNEDGSGANSLLAEELAFDYDSLCTQTALIRYFGYDPDTISGIFRTNMNTNAPIYTDSAWISVLEHEINMGRPLVYEGVDTNPTTGGGHAWVCDGYQSQTAGLDYLHMNWGWSGYADGFFSVDDLLTDSLYSPFNPVSYNDALIGIMPKVNATGIKTVSNILSFNVYPNPASNSVVLQTGGNMTGSTWEFKNLVGQSLMDGSINGSQTSVNISGLSAGVYFVEIHSGEQTAVKKLVVSRQ